LPLDRARATARISIRGVSRVTLNLSSALPDRA